MHHDFDVAFEWPSAEHIPAEGARQGRECVEEYEVAIVRQLQQPDALPIVTADVQIEIRETGLRDRLLSRMQARDRPQNDVVLIATGLIDNDGYALQADRFVFDLINAWSPPDYRSALRILTR